MLHKNVSLMTGVHLRNMLHKCCVGKNRKFAIFYANAPFALHIMQKSW